MKRCWSVVSMIYIIKPQPNNITFGAKWYLALVWEQRVHQRSNFYQLNHTTQQLKLIGLGSNTYNKLFCPILHHRCGILKSHVTRQPSPRNMRFLNIEQDSP